MIIQPTGPPAKDSLSMLCRASSRGETIKPSS
jgi:hypothetical protein